jgi:hypothetical protein
MASLLHTCINTATTCSLEFLPPPCLACQAEFVARDCEHQGQPCPTKDGTPLGDAGGCPCDHCYPRTHAVVGWTFFGGGPR